MAAGIGVVIVAAGRGERAGATTDGPKQYRRIGAQPVLRHTLRAFLDHPAISEVAVAIHPDDRDLFELAAAGFLDRVVAVPGGASRQASTRLALVELADRGLDAVLIHDGVRPFVDGALIDRVVAAIGPETGALPCLPVSDTIKTGENGLVGRTVDRSGLFAAQTPQGFPFAPILAAHERAHGEGREDFTDDAAIAEWAGLSVRIVEGSADNVKLTWGRDIEMADSRLSGMATSLPDIRTGNGYDVHRFAPGDHVTLCGVAIPHDRRLDGHSDADVGLHALTDALLATCGAGDIGTHFPPSDPQWKGAASRIFVEEAVRLVREKGGRIANADVTLVCEAPKIGPHREAMRERIAAIVGISTARVSVKATTSERLGFTGRREGIAALAAATVRLPWID